MLSRAFWYRFCQKYKAIIIIIAMAVIEHVCVANPTSFCSVSSSVFFAEFLVTIHWGSIEWRLNIKAAKRQDTLKAKNENDGFVVCVFVCLCNFACVCP